MANTTIHICALCRREIKNSGLGIHLNNAHKNQITYQQYFDQFIDSKEHTLREAEEHFDLTYERIRQIKNEALVKLRMDSKLIEIG